MSPYQPVEQPPDLGHRQWVSAFRPSGTYPPLPVGPPVPRPGDLTTARQAWASIARVMCRYQPIPFPDFILVQTHLLPWPPQRHSAMVQRVPATRTGSSRDTYQPGRSRRNRPTPRAWRCPILDQARTSSQYPWPSSFQGPELGTQRPIVYGGVPCTRGPWAPSPRRCAAPSHRVSSTPGASSRSATGTCRHPWSVSAHSCSLLLTASTWGTSSLAPATAAGCGRCRRLRIPGKPAEGHSRFQRPLRASAGPVAPGCGMTTCFTAPRPLASVPGHQPTPEAGRVPSPEGSSPCRQRRRSKIPRSGSSRSFPAVPLYCRCTPTDWFPCFRNPVSSTTRTPGTSPTCSTT